MSEFALQTREIHMHLRMLHEKVSRLREQIHLLSVSPRIAGEDETITALLDLEGTLSYFAGHIGLCSDAWNQFAGEAETELQELEREVQPVEPPGEADPQTL